MHPCLSPLPIENHSVSPPSVMTGFLSTIKIIHWENQKLTEVKYSLNDKITISKMSLELSEFF